ncbi:hypothetical protein Bca101_096550 [Brassica carinata]
MFWDLFGLYFISFWIPAPSASATKRKLSTSSSRASLCLVSTHNSLSRRPAASAKVGVVPSASSSCC